MARLTKIYTHTGDCGETGLVAGRRVSKDSPRIWAIGTVDELNSIIGLARALKPDQKTKVVLAQIQNDLFDLGAELATPSKNFITGMPSIELHHITKLEMLIDALNTRLGPLKEFILPSGVPAAAQLHVARTICRRAERVCVRLAKCEKIGEQIVPYLNRLSDALFVLARWVNFKAGAPEDHWQKPSSTNRRQVSRQNVPTKR